MPNQPPELLAPAGNWECARAAVANGADAIYFGLPGFNARLRADNFTREELPDLMRYLHERGRKGYVTMNTLVFTRELGEAADYLEFLHRSGVDAAIVQDVGLVDLSRRLVPDFEIHASTQMTLTSPEGLHFASRLGITRAVVARELSLRELAKFRQESVLPLETFVHGALCVAYSGQCLTSEALGQRSANRGECAQACRLPYELIVDGLARDLGDRRYLLSPQDLAAVREIPQLVELGISSFKIEGRLKTPEYVAAVTQVYRKAIDAALAGQASSSVDEAGWYKLEMSFSRGLFSGWMHGVNHQSLVHARFGKKRGVLLGRIAQTGKDFVELDSPNPSLKPGDGVVFDTGGDTNREQGGRIFELRRNRLFFRHDHLDFTKLKPGDRVWKTDDPRLQKELRQSFVKDAPVLRRRIDFHVSGLPGIPLALRAESQGRTIEAKSSQPLQAALKRPLGPETLREQLGRLGETGFELGRLSVDLPEAVMLPLSELNQLRRAAVDQLQRAASPDEPSRLRINPSALKESLDSISALRGSSASGVPSFTALCRSMEQLQAALDADIPEVYIDFEDIRRCKDAVRLLRSSSHSGTQIFLATPRIQKAGEQGFFKLIENAKPDGVLIRNLGALHYFQGASLRRIGDFSLNVANPLTAQIFMKEGLERLTVSYDLNASQVLDLLQSAPPRWFEITLHQHIPMFHMEHCVFAAFLSNGTDHTNCGRPCDRHQVKLRDRVGMEHPLKADVGCRNTVFHQRAQSGASFFSQFLQAGTRHFRIEFLNEDQSQAARILKYYRQLADGSIDAETLGLELKTANQLGVTSGTLTVLS